MPNAGNTKEEINSPKDDIESHFASFKIAEKTIKEMPQTKIKTTMKTTMKTTTKLHSKLLEIIKNNPTINISELASQMNLSKDGMWYHLKILKQEGFLKRIGAAKGGYWVINKRG